MKNLILSTAAFLTISFTAAATKAEPVHNEKVKKTFVTIFKNAADVKWTETKNNTEAFFVLNEVKTRATFDSKGNLIQTIRYYKENKLSSLVLDGVKSDFPGAEVHGVTEVSNLYGTNYRIVLKDSKYYTHINADNTGDTEIVSKYKRGDK